MKLKNLVVSLTIVGSFLISYAPAIHAESSKLNVVKNSNNVRSVTADIYPKPVFKDMLSQEAMKLNGTVNLVIHGTQDMATVRHIKQLLEDNDISYKSSENIVENEANLLMTSDKDHCQTCKNINGLDAAALDKSNGYVLYTSDNENEKGEIIIIGADEDGVFNGVMTLKQIFEQGTDGTFAQVNIADYPNIIQRGVIEGFYGYPWSFEARVDMIRDMSDFKMNTYMYAPKDDPYHRDKWRELYPENEAKEIRELVEIGKEENVDFVWMIHPGNDFQYGSDPDYANCDDFDKLITKFEQLYNLGIRQFGISYDDLSDWGTNLNCGSQHAEVLKRVKDEWIPTKDDIKPLVTVGSRYNNGWGPSFETYTAKIMEVMDADDIVLWTGRDTMSPISKEIFEVPKDTIGTDKNFSAWWNYPVNDYWDDRLLMQEFGTSVSNDVDNLNAFVLNPMNQAEASKVAIYSGADYAWNTAEFESHSSWQRAIKELTPDTAKSFERFADNIGGIKAHSGYYDESNYLSDKIGELTNELNSKTVSNETATVMLKEFELILQDVKILKNMNNTALLNDCKAHLDAYEALAKAGISGMKAILASNQENYMESLTALIDLRERLNEKVTYTIKSLEAPDSIHNEQWERDNVVNVGSNKLVLLLKQVQEHYEQVVLNKFKTGALEFITNVEDLTAEITSTEDSYTTSPISTQLDSDQWVGMKFSEVTRISKIQVDGINLKDIKLQYSFNGIEWKELKTKKSDDSNIFEDLIDVAYIRLINVTSNTINLDAVSISAIIYHDTRITNPSISATMSFSTSAKFENIMDGDYQTGATFQRGEVGQYLQIDLGKILPIHDIKIYNQQWRNLAKFDLEISNDGDKWRKIGDTIEVKSQQRENITITVAGILQQNLYSTTLDAKGEVGRYIRFTNQEVFSQPSVKSIHEIEVNKSVNHDNEANEWADVIETTLDTNNVKNTYDLNLSTYLTAEKVNNGDTLIYKTNTLTKVGQVMISQAFDHITNAKVEVQDIKGNWIEVGILSKESNTLDVNKIILGIRLTFDGSVTPKISEIIFTEATAKADYSKVDEAIEKANKLNKNDYKDFSLVEKAINAVVRDKNITEQEEVDLMAEAIEDAISKLEKKDNITNKPGEEDNDNIGVKPNPVPDGSNNENLSDSESVNTGDQSVIESYVGIGMLSLLGISLLILRKRK